MRDGVAGIASQVTDGSFVQVASFWTLSILTIHDALQKVVDDVALSANMYAKIRPYLGVHVNVACSV